MNTTHCLLEGYGIPFVFLVMYGGACFGTPGFWCGYGFMLLGFALLRRLTLRFGSLRLLLLGNALSYGSSLLCTLLFQTERWLWSFKAFSTEQLVLLLTLLATAVQLLFFPKRPLIPSR